MHHFDSQIVGILLFWFWVVWTASLARVNLEPNNNRIDRWSSLWKGDALPLSVGQWRTKGLLENSDEATKTQIAMVVLIILVRNQV
jgi:hypothetical protein